MDPPEQMQTGPMEEVYESDANYESVEESDNAASQDTSGMEEQTIAEETKQQGDMGRLSGKSMSILGDSISTFTGYMPSDYNIFYPGSGEIKTVEQTWWHRVLEGTGMVLCANAASSNTTVTGNSLDTVAGGPGCSTRRAMDLGATFQKTPDVILVMMGTNDFLRAVPLGEFQTPLPGEEGEQQNFCKAYELLLQKVAGLYPDSEIYFCTIPQIGAGDNDEAPDEAPNHNAAGLTPQDYNAMIMRIASAYGYPVIDVGEEAFRYEELPELTADLVHPNPEGAKRIADLIVSELLKNRE